MQLEKNLKIDDWKKAHVERERERERERVVSC
jgi:hypothetical protein